jgi:hypothetical protein
MTQSNPVPTPTPAAGDTAPHRPADDREEVYFLGSPKLRGEVLKTLVYGLIGLGLIVGGVYAFSTAWWLGLALCILGAISPVIPIILTKTIRYRISNYRIDVERGLLSKNIDTLELWHVEDIKLHQSLTDRMLGVGRIIIVSHDATTPELVLRDLPDPRPLFEQMKQRIIAVKRQRGVVKMDIG